jgi:hypothetical protein
MHATIRKDGEETERRYRLDLVRTHREDNTLSGHTYYRWINQDGQDTEVGGYSIPQAIESAKLSWPDYPWDLQIDDQSIREMALQRFSDTPELAPYQDLLHYDWPNLNEHLWWVACAPIVVILDWAQSLADLA